MTNTMTADGHDAATLAEPGLSAESRLPASLTWRLLLDPPLAGARNMALDHALASELRPDEAVLRLYGWSRPTVSFGRNEPTLARYGASSGRSTSAGAAAPEPAADPESAASPLDFVRRPTGGRAVVHARELTYAVVAPLDTWGGPRAAYVAINEALAGALAALGVSVDLAGAAAALPLDAGPCFQSPGPGEVTAGGRKLVGSAQARIGRALLQHGSILLEDDQGLLEAGAAATDRGATTTVDDAQRDADRPATLRDLLGDDVSIDGLTDRVAKSLRETFGGRWLDEGYRPAESRAAERLEVERYALDSWTWRR